MICTRSHLVCCEGCMFFLLVLAPGTFPPEGKFHQPVRNTASVSAEAFLSQRAQTQPGSDVPKRAEATCLTEAAARGAKPATSLASWK